MGDETAPRRKQDTTLSIHAATLPELPERE
jgi:hypothetical protein